MPFAEGVTPQSNKTTTMDIIRLQSVTDAQIGEILALMRELDPEITVTPEMVRCAVEAPGTHFFAMLDSGLPAGHDAGAGPHIVGCASLCVTASPTGCKAHIEDVVVLSSYRGRQLGRRLMEYVLGYARKELPAGTKIYLTSRPHRVAANALYQSLGFRRKETNVYEIIATFASQ